MTREPPSLLSSSELRDLSLQPSTIRSARITIIHPQLRDLILPLERGRILYPRGTFIDETRWLSPVSGGQSMEYDTHKSGITGSTRPFLKLSFTPNCLTASRSILACGGQHGELYMTSLPSSSSSRYTSSSTLQPIKPFTMSVTLPSRSINNSLVILPAWPDEWKKREVEKKVGYVGWRSERLSEEIREEDGDFYEYRRRGKMDHDGDDEDRESGGYDDLGEANRWDSDEDERDTEGRSEGEEERDHDDEDLMDLDEDENDNEYAASSSPVSSVATYPNTVPFLHAPRIPHLSPTTTTHDSGSTPRRASSFSNDRPRPSAPPDRTSRQSFSWTLPGHRPGQPPIEFVTSRAIVNAAAERPMSNPSSSRSRAGARSRSRMSGMEGPEAENRSSRLTGSSRRKTQTRAAVPRLLISNNDQSIKMFSLRPVASPSTASSSNTYEGRFDSSRLAEAQSSSVASDRHASSSDHVRVAREAIETSLNALSPRFGSGFGWDNIAIMEGINANNFAASPTPSYSASTRPVGEDRGEPVPHETNNVRRPATDLWGNDPIRGQDYPLDSSGEPDRPWEEFRFEREQRRREFERVVGLRVGGSGSSTTQGIGLCPPFKQEEMEERKLVKVGGTQFKLAVNHSSLSPDLKTMVTVGDSTDVFLHEVIQGGKEFRRIGVYSAATDYGFSTSWSKDGRKFAVASQDGQVTVWDHRSSRPLAIFYTSPISSGQFSSPSFTSDMLSHRRHRSSLSFSSDSSEGSQPWETADANGYPMLVDPVTGDSRMGSSTSGREAARVVKFSPEGSDRDLMVFSEENTNIHMVDARTFNTHVILPVPLGSTSTSNENISTRRGRPGVEGGTWGIAGVSFDPTGDWLYSGTEQSVVEWDLRRYGGGEGGTWAMA